MAVKIAHDLDIFALLSQEDCVTCERLAKAKSADPQLIGEPPWIQLAYGRCRCC